MRIPSGKTDIYIYFVALNAALDTRVTGISSWTVYRSRNGGTATVYTTPTVTELSAANMGGVYALLIDEDTTIGGSSDSEEYAVHITATGMAPVTRTIELYRAVPTAAQNATELLDQTNTIETGLTVRGALRLNTSALAGKISGAGTTTETFRNSVADSKNRIVSTVDSSGNRTAITTDVT